MATTYHTYLIIIPLLISVMYLTRAVVNGDVLVQYLTGDTNPVYPCVGHSPEYYLDCVRTGQPICRKC